MAAEARLTSVNRMGGSGLSIAESRQIEAFVNATWYPDTPLVGVSDTRALAGKALFEREDVGCATCHSGEHYTDQAEYTMLGLENVRTPTLLGIAATGPYLHDGSAASLEQVIQVSDMGVMGDTSMLSEEEKADLVFPYINDASTDNIPSVTTKRDNEDHLPGPLLPVIALKENLTSDKAVCLKTKKGHEEHVHVEKEVQEEYRKETKAESAALEEKKTHSMGTISLAKRFGRFWKRSIGQKKQKPAGVLVALKIENEVVILNNIDQKLKVALIKNSNLFLMPSIKFKKSVEGFGIAFIEAACYGKPSIGGIYGGEADAIKSGETGYLCDGNDLNALYETLLKTLSNEQYKKLGENAFEFSKNFNWDKIIKNYINLI